MSVSVSPPPPPHTHTHSLSVSLPLGLSPSLSLSVSLPPSLSLSVCLSVSVSLPLSLSPSLFVSVCLPPSQSLSLHLCLCLTVSVSLPLSLSPSIFVCVFVSLPPFLCLSAVSLSVRPSVCLSLAQENGSQWTVSHVISHTFTTTPFFSTGGVNFGSGCKPVDTACALQCSGQPGRCRTKATQRNPLPGANSTAVGLMLIS